MFNLKQYLWKLIDYFCKYLPNRYYAKTDKMFASKQVLLKTVHI